MLWPDDLEEGVVILPFWPCSSVGKAAVIKSEGRGLDSHPGQSFSLSLYGPVSLTWANAQKE